MSYSREKDARFVRALMRSAAGDASRAGAAARAGVRLGVGHASTPAPFGLVGALLLAAVTLAAGWSPHPVSIDDASGTTASAADSAEDCREGVETPRWPCGESSRSAALSRTMNGSSSGADSPGRGSSGG